MSEGLRWARSVLHEVAALLTLAALTAGVTVGGLLLHRPAWFLGVFGVVLLLVVLGEGAYRVWREADAKPTAAAGNADADAVWLSEQLSAGNELLASWPGKPRYNATEEIHEAYKWEHQTQEGLAARLPTHSGHFGVEVGFSPDWYSDSLVGPERGYLRRRIHRLAEINERYGRERTK